MCMCQCVEYVGAAVWWCVHTDRRATVNLAGAHMRMWNSSHWDCQYYNAELRSIIRRREQERREPVNVTHWPAPQFAHSAKTEAAAATPNGRDALTQDIVSNFQFAVTPQICGHNWLQVLRGHLIRQTKKGPFWFLNVRLKKRRLKIGNDISSA